MPATYADRDRVLRAMGYPSYPAYLRGSLWRAIRLTVMRHWRRRCGVCGAAARQVHHLDYARDTLEGARLTGLVPVCRRCHRRIEVTPTGAKRTLAGAALTYASLVAESLVGRRAATRSAATFTLPQKSSRGRGRGPGRRR